MQGCADHRRRGTDAEHSAGGRDVIDAIHIDLRAFIYTLHLDATSFTLNQYGVSRDVSYAVGDSFRLGLLVYPAERSCCRFRVFIARLSGIDADFIVPFGTYSVALLNVF